MADKQHTESQQPPQEAGKPETQTEQPTHGDRRRLVMAGMLLLLVVAGVSAIWAGRTWREARLAQSRAQQLEEERDQAQKAEAEAKRELEQALTDQQTAKEERAQAREAEKAARDSENDTEAVLTFLRDNLLAVGHPEGWGREADKNVTLRQAVDVAEAKVAEKFADRPRVEASIRMILGSTYGALGQDKLAVPQLKRAMELREALFGFYDQRTGECRQDLAKVYRQLGRPDDASQLFNLNPLSPNRAAALSVQGAALLAEKKPSEAELKLRESLTIRQTTHPNNWITFDTQSMLGEALLEQKKYAQAEPLLLAGYDGLKQRRAKIPLQQLFRLTRAIQRLVRLYTAWGKPEEASRWRKELEAATPQNGKG
jgi:hypothetical protein